MQCRARSPWVDKVLMYRATNTLLDDRFEQILPNGKGGSALGTPEARRQLARTMEHEIVQGHGIEKTGS